MNAAYYHLLLNHIPVLGSVFGTLLLLFGILRGNKTLMQTALYTFIIAAAVTLPVDWTGEDAEHLVEEMGVSHDLIHEHEEMAEISVKLMLGLGGLSFATLILQILGISFAQIFNYITLVLAFVVIGFMSQTAHSGGLIRHPEIQSDFDISKYKSSEEVHSDDDSGPAQGEPTPSSDND